MVDSGIEKLRIQAHSEIEAFVLEFTKKYKSLFVRNKFAYRVRPDPDHRLFPYEVYLEITEQK